MSISCQQQAEKRCLSQLCKEFGYDFGYNDVIRSISMLLLLCSAVAYSTVVDSVVLGSDMVVEPFVGRETAVIKIIYYLWYILAWLI